jgi:hypothetical protein
MRAEGDCRRKRRVGRRLGALVGPVWSPPPRAPDPTLPTAVWPCLLPARHSHHRDRGDSRRSGDRSGWWCGGYGPGAQCDVRPSIQLNVRRYPADASLEPSLPFVDWMARLRKATARPSATLLANHLRWQAPQRRATSLRWLLAASDCTHVGLFACPSGSEAVRLVSLRVSALFSTARSLPYHASGVRLL